MYKNTQCKMQAHRGVNTEAPENTIPAYALAVKQGYDIIEADPKFTKDNVCVMLHDHTLTKTARKNGEKISGDVRVEDVNYAELLQMDFGVWKAPEYEGTPIPTLAEALSFARDAGIEMKIDNVIEHFTEEQQRIVFEAVRKYGGKVGITAAHTEFIARVAEELPSAVLHYDGTADDAALEKLDRIARGRELYIWARMDNAKTSWCKTPAVDAEYAAKIKKHGKLGIWILSEESEMERAVTLGADVVETNGELKP